MKFIGFDIETAGNGDAYGLQPYRVRQGTARITSFAFVTEEGDVLFSGLNPEVYDIRQAILWILHQYPEAVLIGWNTQFDVSWLIANGLETEVRACQWLDGQVLRRILENDTDQNKRYGLKPTVAKYLPEYEGYGDAFGANFNTVFTEPAIDQTLLDYNILDAGLTAKLGRIFIDLLDDRSLTLATIICQAIVPVAGAWNHGINIGIDALNKWESDIDADMVEHFANVMTLGGIKPDEFDEARKMLTSPVKLKRYLTIKGFPVKKTDRAELSLFAHIPLVKAISDYKKASTSKTKFIGGIRKALVYNAPGVNSGWDTVHPSCRLFNTYTGRLGYTSTTTKKKLQTGIAIHQFPRGAAARNCIVAPDGYLLGEIDFATQESRLMCDWSNDPVLFDIFTTGKDIHSFMASIIENVEYEAMLDRLDQKDARAKEMRYLAKVVNLSCQYRTGWKKLIEVGRVQYDVIFDERTAQQLHRMYRDVYKNVPIYWDSAIRQAKADGYALTRGGRRVYITDWSRANSWSSESTAINFPIQGTGADMKFLAISQIDKPLYEGAGQYLLDMHDAAFILVPDTSKGYDLAVECQRIMSNLPYEDYYNWSPKVALPVDLKIGKAWGSLTEVK